MPNDYYNYTTPLVPNTKVRSDALNTQYKLIEEAFDKLQDPSLLGSGSFIYADDSGEADNYVLTNNLLADEVELNKGQLLSFTPANSNTGASVIALNGGTSQAVVRNDGLPVEAEDFLVGVPVLLIYDIFTTRWVLIGASSAQVLSSFRPNIVTEATIARTISSSDEASLVLCENDNAVTITVPETATEDLFDGFVCHVYQHGAGQVTIEGEPGVTLHYASSTSTRAQYSSLSIIKVADNDYHVIGDAEASDIADAIEALGITPGRTFQYYRLTVDDTYDVDPIEMILREIILEVNGTWVQSLATISGNTPQVGAVTNLNDLNLTTSLASYQNPIGKEFYWDFGETPQRLTHIRQVAGSTEINEWIGAFTLEASDDQITWICAAEISNIPSASDIDEISAPYPIDWCELQTIAIPPGGTTGQILAKKTDDDGDAYWIDAPSGGGGGVAHVLPMKTASFTAASNEIYYVDVKAASANVVMTMPASPSDGDVVGYAIEDFSFNYTVVVDGNGNSITANSGSSTYNPASDNGGNWKGMSFTYASDANNNAGGWIPLSSLLWISAG